MNKHLLKGNKFNSNHQTYIVDAELLLNELKKCDSVQKIFLGFIKRIKIGVPSLKIKSIKNNYITIVLRGKNAVQEFGVVSTDVNFTLNTIQRIKKWDNYR